MPSDEEGDDQSDSSDDEDDEDGQRGNLEGWMNLTADSAIDFLF